MQQTDMLQPGETRSRRDVIAGAVFVAIALLFLVQAVQYPIGRALRMGPGFIPLVLSVILAVLGTVIIVAGLRRHEAIKAQPVAWKGIILVCAALALFGKFGASLGLVPVVFVGTAMVALSSARNSVLAALAIAAAMSALCWLIFKVGLGVSLPSFGPLFSF